MDEDEQRAIVRIRVLRRDGYRCKARPGPHAPICGAYGSAVGNYPTSAEIVTLCASHALECPC